MTKKEKEIADMWKEQRDMLKERMMEEIFQMKYKNKKKKKIVSYNSQS